jgi:hypothetical protein
MPSRLALKYGLVSEEDRLSNSSDALLVSEPTTGSKARTKGSLYVVVTSSTIGGRTRDACLLVADTIRREYYYDESAGIAIVLEKAIRSANRRLLHAREGSGVQQGSLGVAVAVVRGNELYVATCGGADSYLIRSARLLTPEHQPGGGLPVTDAPKIDVWRGDFAVGDSLVLCSRNLVDVVGTEELKNAVVTLHPQSAVEHLHHLFVAAGGDGSDGVLAIEATEVALSRVEHKLVPVSPSEPLAGAPMRSPIPLADQLAGAAAAVRQRGVAARSAVRDAFSGAVSRVLDLMPRRRATYRRASAQTAPGETRRRAAIAALALIGVLAVVGAVVWFAGPFRSENPNPQLTEGEAAFAEANTKVSQVFGSADLIHTDPAQATTLLQGAWADVGRAATGVDQARITQMRDRISSGLDQLYSTFSVTSTKLYAAPSGTELSGLVEGPVQDQVPYVIAGSAVMRIDPTSGAVATVVQAGDGASTGIGPPALLAHGGPDLLIVDSSGGLWRWRPSDTLGDGTLGQVRVAGDQAWGNEVVDVETFDINPDQGLYRLYVPYPPSGQILRYDPTADGSGFSAPNPYFVSEGEDVASFHRLLVDGDVYAVTSDNLIRYFNGRRTTFALADPPDNGDLRPGHDYRLVAATGARGAGRLFAWDTKHARILVFNKSDGSYVEQFVAAAGSPDFAGVTGMYLIDRGDVQPPILVWTRPDGLYQTVLEQPAAPTPSPSPSARPTTTSSPVVVTPAPSETPGGPTPSPSTRPRRTPRVSPTP